MRRDIATFINTIIIFFFIVLFFEMPSWIKGDISLMIVSAMRLFAAIAVAGLYAELKNLTKK